MASLLPLVSLSVAVILFEGGLSLKVCDSALSAASARLTTVGVLVTWCVGLAAARFLLGFEWPLAALLAAILVVTGPTVIGPILRRLHLGGRAGAVLKWEAIVIDPIEATLALPPSSSPGPAAGTAARPRRRWPCGTVLVGGGLGLLGRPCWCCRWPATGSPTPACAVALAAVFLVFAAANALQEEAGLLAVTVMGVGLANQRLAPIRHLVEFKENLTVLLVSCLFILLAVPCGPATCTPSTCAAGCSWRSWC